ncbi:MAG: DNA primase [Bacteroidetes bacterium]|jgi:DNA primase|nr:DNA primase [Bacteroidota bacterium]MDB4124108.1 DNA primase [Schleiferiaceae bacterium]MDB9837326.1 DNA primase [Schleiferiaceae bacterium]MDC1224987.1 DNA primase [Schleiferiaceae bacterium]MDC1493777.1 DNA primase [Schleiferiaceae bacterium]
MSRIPESIIEQIFSTAQIEEVIGEFVQLKKSGSNLKGLSPFNNEKSPSFMVSPAKQIFKDFSSGKGGNVVTFLMELEQMSYPEALRWIAKKYNIEIPEERPQTPEEIAAGNLKEGVYLISDVAAKWYVQQLHETDQGKAIGLSYFKERGFTDETIKKFHLGYSPEQSSAFADYALASSYSEQSLESSGISMRNERGWYDRFRGRVMFPIHSISGRVLGFGGRILQSNAKAAKYLNSPENPIYHKSKVLYGLFQAKQEIVKRDEALLVEGYTDVLSFYQNGVQNVVSSSGTALTEGQIAMLKRYTPNITLLYDGDAAGIRASFRGLDMMLEQGVNVRVVPFPDGEDPDSFAQAHSTEELEKYIKSNRRDFISFKTGVLIDEAAGDPLKRAQMVREIVASIAKVPDRIGQEVFVKEAARLLDIDAAALFDELYRLLNDQSRQARRKQQQEPPMEVVTGGVPEEAKILGYEQEKTLIHLAISKGTEIMLEEGIDPEEVNPVTVADWIKQELDNDGITFQVPVFAKVYGLLCAELEEGEVPVTSWWVRQPDPEVVELVTEALTEKYTLAKWEAREIYLPKEKNIIFSLVRDTVFRFKYMHVQRQLELLKSKLDGDDIQIDHYMNEFSKWNQLRQMLDDELNRVV